MKFNLTKRFDSFTFLNITQFLGALNDNIFKLLIAFFLIDAQGEENSPKVLAIAGAIFVIPFLIFSASAGKLADRYSKRNIIVFSKSLEAVVMFLGIIAFTFRSEWGSYAILWLMATQSAIFSPSKYGIVPEIVESDRISQANGMLTSFTFLATIIGTFLASFITDMSGRNFILASCVCLLISLLGLYTSFYIEHTPAMGSKKRFNIFFLKDVFRTLKRARMENRLFCAMLGSSYFLLLAAYVQLNIIPFSIQTLHLSDVWGGYLFLLTALGIGSGSILAGKLSGKHVELGLVPFAGIGIGITTIALYAVSDDSFSAAVICVIILGLFGGLWVVPMDSFIQVASPEHQRGQMIAATNFLAFSGVLIASLMLYVFSHVLGMEAASGFLIVGLMTIIVTLFITGATLDYFLRFLAFTITRLGFRLKVTGNEKIPKDSPSLILCNRSSSWIDALLLTGTQRPPLRFLIESSRCKNKWLKMFFKLMRVIFIPEHSEDVNEYIYLEAKKGLDKGYTVCIFAKTTKDNDEAMAKYLESFREYILHTPYPIIPVKIDEKPLHPASGSFWDLMKEFPWKVSITIGENRNVSNKTGPETHTT
ncbi:Uncharacterized protein SCG7109_AQ_00020 [Chlamydiales bacterium SCGC AG-110-M15]|nr:Uncharacterized protein SCG7109_AQ_00020 [Chlamydiales bacterium SCGC AG-110-M15]